MKKEAIKDRLNYQKAKAKKYYRKKGATIIESNNEIICFIANFKTHEEKIRIVLDKITENDIDAIKEINAFPFQSRLILCAQKGKRESMLIELLDNRNIEILYEPDNHGKEKKVMSIPKFLDVYTVF